VWRRGWESSERLGYSRYNCPLSIELLSNQSLSRRRFLRAVSPIRREWRPVPNRCHSECHSALDGPCGFAVANWPQCPAETPQFLRRVGRRSSAGHEETASNAGCRTQAPGQRPIPVLLRSAIDGVTKRRRMRLTSKTSRRILDSRQPIAPQVPNGSAVDCLIHIKSLFSRCPGHGLGSWLKLNAALSFHAI